MKGKLRMNEEILKNVYELAKKKYYKYSQTHNSNGTMKLSLEELRSYNEEIKNDELFKYLNSLSYDDNIMIISAMYIGRDYSEEEFAKEEKLFDRMLKDMKCRFPTKEFVIKQIYQKVPLHKYLEKSFQLYSIKL